MFFFLYVLIYICATKCATITTSTNTTNVTDVIEKPKIQDLEEQKGLIYNEINLAIEDTIKTLEKANDTDAKEGITYMKELMTQIKEFNGTELILEDDSANNSSEDSCDHKLNEIKPDNNTDFLKSGRRKLKKPTYTGYEKIKDAILNYGIFGSKKKIDAGNIVSKKKQTRLENRLELQKRLDAWMAQREVEKAKIKQYKAKLQIVRQSANTERCPDFGEAKNKKKKKSGSSLDKLPCCRKCCKQSYLGCL